MQAPDPRPTPVPQPVAATLSRAAIFLVLGIRPGDENAQAVHDLGTDLAAYVRTVGFRNPEAMLSCVMAIGSVAWDRVYPKAPRPEELHPFREIGAGPRHAPSTPGDVLLHIRARHLDLCFEIATLVLSKLAGKVDVIDEVQGFRYFDQRDLLGFVDGTEDPTGPAASAAVLLDECDPLLAGGSYVIVQKYLHDLAAWNRLPTETQERIIGRYKLSNVEIDDDAKAPYAHNVLTSITDADGKERKILRDNMPFGKPGAGEFGTYFIGYCHTPTTIEKMLQNMFVGNPPGTYDRLLDVSRPLTGCLFFAPSATFLEDPPGS